MSEHLKPWPAHLGSGDPGMIDLDTFAGPGGWSEAADALGIRDIGIEWDKSACLTRAAAGHLTIRADVASFPVARLAGKVRGLRGSPSCKRYSGAGTGIGRLVTDILLDAIPSALAGEDRRAEVRAAIYPAALECRQERDGARAPGKRWDRGRLEATARDDAFDTALVLEPARYIAASRPEWIALEQVPSVLPLWQAYADGLRRMGYSAWAGKLNAADYGVPQTRERAILIASRAREVHRPEPTHYDPQGPAQLFGTPWLSMWDALGWGATGRPAPTVTSGGTATGGAEPFGHWARQALAAERDAGRWVFRNNSNVNACSRPLSMPAGTIFFGGRANWAGWVREDGDGRAVESVNITVTEAGLLQSFSASYPWRGTVTKQKEQAGNAVPPLLAIPVLGVAAGIDWAPVAEAYSKAIYRRQEAAA